MKRIHGAFINARYSTDLQNADSIDVQVNACREWCEQRNIPVLGIYADEAVSGMKESRPQYDAMMQQLRLGFADIVVVYDQSRLFRKMSAWFNFRDELAKMGVSVASVTQPMIGKDLRDPINLVTEGSMALFNQMWVLQTRQKVIEKMRFMANNGLHTGGKPALGYEIKDGKLAICEAEAAIVRRIFSEYANGLSYREIIEGLNRDGLKTKYGNSFGTNSLHDLMKNEKYIGTIVYGASPYREDGSRNTHAKDGENVIRLEDAIPAIVDKDTFRRVQEKMKQNKHNQSGRPPKAREYKLKGKVFCGDCKSSMHVSTSRRDYNYYSCSGKKRTHTCPGNRISVDELEDVVYNTVKQMLGNPKNVERLIEVLRSSKSKIQVDCVEQMRKLTADYEAVTKKIENGINAILAGITSPELKQKLAELEAEKRTIDGKMRQLKATMDATGLQETVLREQLETIVAADNTSVEVVFAVVCRVEVYQDVIKIWTIIDPDSNPREETEEETDAVPCELVIKTPGTGFGVPRVFITARFIRALVVRTKKGTSM